MGGLQPWSKTVWRFHKALTIELPHDLASPLLALDPEGRLILNDTCIPFFRAALLTLWNTQHQPKYPSIEKWRVTSPLYTGIHSALKKNKNTPYWPQHGWTKRFIILGEVCQRGKEKCLVTYRWNLSFHSNELIYKQKRTHRLRKPTYGYFLFFKKVGEGRH